MNAMMRFLTVFFLLGSLMGCASKMQAEYPVPVVSDTPKMLTRERQKLVDEHSESGPKLKNLSAADHLEKGTSALRRNDFSLSRFHFSLAVAKDEKFVEAYLGLSESLIRENKYQAARTVLKKALEIDSENLQVMAKLGILCRFLDENEKALEHLTRAVEFEPANPELVTELAVTYEKAGQAGKAERYFREAVELAPESTEALNNLGFNFLVQEKYRAAIPVLERALRLNPENRLAKNNLALAYAFNNQARRALQIFESLVGKAGAYNNLGYLLMLQDYDRDAEMALSRALELSPVFYARAKENLELLKMAKDEQSLFD